MPKFTEKQHRRRNGGGSAPASALTAVLLSVFLFALPVSAQQSQNEQELQRLEQQAKEDEAQARKLEAQARKDRQEIKGARGQLITAANKIQNLEEDLTRIENTLDTLEEEESDKGSRLYENRQSLARVLSALQRIAIQPPEAIVAAPGDPLDTVRSAIVLETAIPDIEKQVNALRDDLSALAELRDRIRQEREDLLAARQDLQKEQRSVEKLLGQKKAQEKKNTAALEQRRKRAKALADKANGLRDLIARLKEIDRQQPPLPKPKPSAPETSGSRNNEQETAALTPSFQVTEEQIRAFPKRPNASVLSPARGSITKNFGQNRADQTTFREGILIETRPRAQVIAPFDGRVVYAGNFRGYGNMIIIEHSDRPGLLDSESSYHSLLAGLNEISVLENQLVLAGEPLAWMQDGSLTKPEIYYELRRGGRPINPLPWLKR